MRLHHIYMKYKIFLPFCAALLGLLCGCGEKKLQTPSKPVVLTSIPPYAYFVQKIAGDKVDIHVVVPPGTNPHLFEPTPREFEKMKNAAIWIQIGEMFEKKMTRTLKEQNPTLDIVNLEKFATLHEHCEHCHENEGVDRHIWLSPALDKAQARDIEQALAKLLPQDQQELEKNLTSFLGELEQLDQEIAQKLSPFKGDAILTSHPAFGYFCHEFHLTQLSIENEGKDPRPQDIIQVLNDAQNAHVRVVLLEPQYSNKGAQLVADNLKLPVFVIDPYARDVPQTLRSIANVIALQHE